MQSFSIRKSISTTWWLWRATWRLWAGIGLVNMAVTALINIAVMGMRSNIWFVVMLQVMTVVVGAVFGLVISFGTMKITLLTVDRIPPKFNDLFRHWRQIWKWLCAMIVSGVLSFLFVAILFLLPLFRPAVFDSPLGLLMRIIYCLPVAYLWVRLQFTALATLDGKGLGVAFKTSWQITKGNVIRLVLFGIALLVLGGSISLVSSLPTFISALVPASGIFLAIRAAFAAVGSLMTLAVSVVLTGPLSLLALASVYRKLSPVEKTS